jgi:hypothetical protein
LNRRHHRCFSPENCEPPPQNTLPSILLRPNRHRRRPQGEALVRLDPFPSFPSHRSSLPGRPSPVSGSRSGWPMPSRPDQRGQRGLPVSGPRDPPVSALGHFDPDTKGFAQ